jgi:hypothetical protein
MKEKNTQTLTIISMSLLALSLLSFTIWGFLKFTRNESAGQMELFPISATNSDATSGQMIKADINNENRLKAATDKVDSLERLLVIKNAEYDSLKQVEAELRKTAPQNAANEGTDETNRILIKKVSELSDRIQQLERENNQLTISLNRLESLRKKRVAVPLEDNPTIATPSNTSSHRALLRIKIPTLKAIYTAGIYEKETEDADQTEMLKGSFICENKTDESVAGEIIMVLTDPAGNEVNINRESGIFDSERGRITYTCKFSLTLNGWESKDLPFRVRKDGFLRGTYKMELFFEGRSMAEAEILLN